MLGSYDISDSGMIKYWRGNSLVSTGMLMFLTVVENCEYLNYRISSCANSGNKEALDTTEFRMMFLL